MKLSKKTVVIIIIVVLVLVFGIIGAVTGAPSSKQQPATLESSSISSQSETSVEPESSEEIKPLDLDIPTLSEELKNDINDSDSFSYVQDVSVSLLEDGSLGIIAIVDDSTEPSVALDLADTLIRRCNLSASILEPTIKGAEGDYYGGLYDYYSALIGVAPLSQVDNTDKWFVYEAITSGKKYRELELTKEYQ